MRLTRRHLGLGIGVLAVGGFFFTRFLHKTGNEAVETTAVRRGTIRHEVEFSGHLDARQRVTLAFERGGIIAAILVTQGSRVQRGDLVARLNNDSAVLDEAKAFADRVSTETRTRNDRDAAQEALANIQSENVATLSKRRHAVRDAKRELDQGNEVWQQSVRESGDEASTTRTKYLAVLQSQTAYHTSQQLLREDLAATKRAESAARASLNAAVAAYRATLSAAEGQPGLSALEALEQLTRVRREQGMIRAPFTGVVTDIPIEPGEYVMPGSSVVTVQTLNELEVVADVPETDLAKLAVGMRASFTTDAYGLQTTWEAEIRHLAPAAKTIEGVPTYRVRLRLLSQDERLRQGMSVTVTVQTAVRERVLLIPRRAVVTGEIGETVRVRGEDGTIEERTVTTGVAGADGNVEVTSGLRENERVVTKTPSRS